MKKVILKHFIKFSLKVLSLPLILVSLFIILGLLWENLESVLSGLNKYNHLVVFVFSLLMVIINVVYIWLIKKQLFEISKQRIIDDYPNLQFEVDKVDIDERKVNFIISNLGRGHITNLDILPHYIDHKNVIRSFGSIKSKKVLKSLKSISRDFSLDSDLELTKIQHSMFLKLSCSFEDMSKNLYFYTVYFVLGGTTYNSKLGVYQSSQVLKKIAFDDRREVGDGSLFSFSPYT